VSKKTVIFICVCTVICALIMLYAGTPWGHALAELKFRRFIAEQFADTDVSSVSARYDSYFQQYVMYCYDNTHEFNFCVYGSPYASDAETDYMFRYWENDIGSKYAEKYPMYTFLPSILADYPWIHTLPAAKGRSFLEYEACAEVPLTIGITTSENVMAGYSDTMRELLADLRNDFGNLPLFDVIIDGADGTVMLYADQL
jgi:hypothetical protein